MINEMALISYVEYSVAFPVVADGISISQIETLEIYGLTLISLTCNRHRQTRQCHKSTLNQ